MLTKMILKILFKATIPIVIMVGLMSYVMYMNGGNPGGIYAKLIGNSFQSAKSSIQGAGDSLKSASPGSKPSSKTTVYQWVDENGVTQFGSKPPEGIAASSKTFNNNANIMDAMPKPKAASYNAESIPGLDGEKLPGVAGMDLPVAVDPATMSQFLQSMQQQQ